MAAGGMPKALQALLNNYVVSSPKGVLKKAHDLVYYNIY